MDMEQAETNVVELPSSKAGDRLYFRPVEVARLTGLSRSTVFAALYSGQLRGFQRGRAWLIPPRAIDEWIQGDGAVA